MAKRRYPHRGRCVAGVLLVITLLAMAAPAGAAELTIDPGAGAIQAGIDSLLGSSTDPSDTLILNPGTYNEHTITIRKNIMIRAADGHGPADTIIDAQSLGRIFDDAGNYALAIDNLTLQNGIASSSSYYGHGGAIYAGSGSVTVTSSEISGCRSGDSPGYVSGHGGAIYSYSGSVTVTSTTISGCQVGDGTYSPSGNGGAIYTDIGIVTVTSSTISNCRAGDDFITGGWGGAIATNSGSVTVTSSTISDCRAGDASVGGGWGGAIATSSGSVTVTSSTISNCRAGNPWGDGGAIYTSSGSGTVHFSRLISNYAPDEGDTFYGPIAAHDNWWGSNAGPSSDDLFSGATAPTWLVLGITASPSAITTAETSTIRANLSYHTDGSTVSLAPGPDTVPDGIPAAFAASNGGVLPGSATTISGIASATFTPSGAGTGTVSVTVDSAMVSVPVELIPIVSSIEPATGPAAGVTRVTITGTGFNGASGAAFDGTPGTNFTVMDSTHITVDSPAHAPGTGHVRVRSSSGSLSAETSADIFIWTGSATHLYVSASSPQTAGTPFDFMVTALDALGNRVSDYAGTVHLSSSDAIATCPADYTFVPGDAGVHNFPSGATFMTAGTQFITAIDTVDGTITGDSAGIDVGAGPAAHFTVTASATATAGIPLTVLTVTAIDAAGNTNDGYTGTVHFTGSDATATYPADYTFVAGDAGVHSFASEATLRTAGTQYITATDTITTSVTGTSGTITVSPGPATHVTVTAPATAAVENPVDFDVAAVDDYENTVTGYTGTVTFSSSDSAATLPGASTLTGGRGTFPATFMTAGIQTITATGTDGPSTITGTSGTIRVLMATHFSVTAPASATTGLPLTITVTALDDDNNPVTGYAGTVHFTSSDPAATLPADTTLTGGTGAFSAILRTLGPQTITATGPGSSTITGTSGSIAVSDRVYPSSPDDPFPSSPGTGSGAGNPSNLPLMTVTVNIGGDSKAWQATVTGTKLSELIVTGTVQNSAGGNLTAPPGTVYQYISLVPARFNSITKAVIRFTVPQAWLDENNIDPKSIVLYRSTANGWEALPTTIVETRDGTVYYSAESTGFSLFAIAGMPGGAAAAVSAPVAATGGLAEGQEQVRTTTVKKAPAPTQTTAPAPAIPAPAGSSGFPFMTPVLIVTGCVVLIAGGWYVRRWWIRRQNPALFKEYD